MERSRKPRPTLTTSWWRWGLRLAVPLTLLLMIPVAVLRFVNPPTSSFMLQRRWQTRAQKRIVLQHRWVPLSKVSKNMQLALVAAEDQHFFTHHGFDFDSMLDAVSAKNQKRVRGASTLTQQVAKNLFLWPGHSYLRKAIEALYTVVIELCWPKSRILEMHLNLAEYGDGVYGIEAASRFHFHKTAAELTLSESSALAAVLPSPKKRSAGALSERASERAAWIEAQAIQLGFDWLKP